MSPLTSSRPAERPPRKLFPAPWSSIIIKNFSKNQPWKLGTSYIHDPRSIVFCPVCLNPFSTSFSSEHVCPESPTPDDYCVLCTELQKLLGCFFYGQFSNRLNDGDGKKWQSFFSIWAEKWCSKDHVDSIGMYGAPKDIDGGQHDS